MAPGRAEGAPAAGPVLKSGGSRRGREPPEPLPSAPLTPTSRKGVNIKADAGRQFLEEEAEVSLLEAEGISSDESDGTGQELSQSLVQFLDDEGEPTQALSDSEMRAVYLSSVRSPTLGSRYKMVHKDFNPSAIFSQIPEQDVTYAEDSFCVGDEEEEAPSGCSEEEECVDFELLTREGSRQQYLTRRRRRLSLARRAGNAPAPVQKKKPSRIIVLSDSSEDEMGASRERPLEAGQGRGQLPKALPSAPSAQPRSGAGEARAPQAGGQDTERLLGLEASMSGMLDPPPQQPGRSTSIPPAGSGCRNTDLQAGAEVSAQGKPGCSSLALDISRTISLPLLLEALYSQGNLEYFRSEQIKTGLRFSLGLTVMEGGGTAVCTDCLGLVLQSELQSPGNRNKLSQRLQRLQGIFERICVIVETDRVRPGETSRCFQRTQHYDGVLSALVQAGIRILFSSCQEETAALLKELALLEHRKDAAIQVPTEPEGHRRDILNFYLSIPNLSYGAALNLCHSFGSITAVANR
uniref:FANCM protein n=1 Tax=Serinus canaria TaxID=9135 RepID=A0A8C9NX76_SERCA